MHLKDKAGRGEGVWSKIECLFIFIIIVCLLSTWIKQPYVSK